MAKAASRFVCQACGAQHTRWIGRCDGCGEWNSIIEEAAPPPLPGGGGKAGRSGAAKVGRLEFSTLSEAAAPPPRLSTGVGELDRASGGGLVAGSAVLIGGDPGIGKSTLLMQAAARAANAGARCVYISGEEAADQVRMRAMRLGAGDAPVKLAAATALRDILPALEAGGPDGRLDLVVIDSIQTMWHDQLDSAPGSVAQVRACAQELIRCAKKRGFALVLVGHVTKEGAIAGPRVLEHMVDAVLYFEGERGHQFRIVRAVKNRFGPSDEIGVFEMSDSGLIEAPNPSALFLAERRSDVSGAVVFAGMEGARPVLVEIQALVGASALGTPRRAVVGWDSGRLAMILAVLDARCGLSLAGSDVYLNVVGGLKITEPAADLAVAAALISAAADEPAPADTVIFGEVGLGGEVRRVGQSEPRIKEALRLGFERALIPARSSGSAGGSGGGAAAGRWHGLAVTEIDRLGDLVDLLAPAGIDESLGRRVPRS